MPTAPQTYLHQEYGEDTDMRWHEVTLLNCMARLTGVHPQLQQTRVRKYSSCRLKAAFRWQILRFKTEHGAPFTLYFKPVIVRLCSTNHRGCKTGSFRVIWNMAMQSIAEAEHITFIGYSSSYRFLSRVYVRQGIT
jgi:hypothetical protein